MAAATTVLLEGWASLVGRDVDANGRACTESDAWVSAALWTQDTRSSPVPTKATSETSRDSAPNARLILGIRATGWVHTPLALCCVRPEIMVPQYLPSLTAVTKTLVPYRTFSSSIDRSVSTPVRSSGNSPPFNCPVEDRMLIVLPSSPGSRAINWQ